MNEDEWVAEFYKHMNRIDDKHDALKEEFRKLLVEPCQKIPKPGDKVVVAGGLLSMGHPWIRIEAEVTDVADTSVKVRIDRKVYIYHEWIHPALITDVLP